MVPPQDDLDYCLFRKTLPEPSEACRLVRVERAEVEQVADPVCFAAIVRSRKPSTEHYQGKSITPFSVSSSRSRFGDTARWRRSYNC